MIAVLHPVPQGFGDVLAADFQPAAPPNHEGCGVMHADPILGLILKPPNLGGIGRMDLAERHLLPGRLPLDRGQ